MKILKWELSRTDGRQEITTPVNTQILAVLNQFEGLVVYGLCRDPDSDLTEKHKFLLAMTGGLISDEDLELNKYLGTVLFVNGAYVVHIYEVRDDG
jgi:hypothetical protein